MAKKITTQSYFVMPGFMNDMDLKEECFNFDEFTGTVIRAASPEEALEIYYNHQPDHLKELLANEDTRGAFVIPVKAMHEHFGVISSKFSFKKCGA
jgi:hypothetical protein